MKGLSFKATVFLTLVVGLVVAAAACAPAAAPEPTAAPAVPPTAVPAAAPTAAPAVAAPTAAPAVAQPPALTKEYRISMATGGTAGTYYPFGGAIASVWSQSIPGVSVTVEATGASLENLRLLDTKAIELALVQNDNADYAWNGIELFKEPVKGFRSVAALYPEMLHWIFTVDSGVQEITDVKGKRMGVGPAGSGTETNTRQVFEAAGMTYNDLGRMAQLSFAEATAAVKDRQLDGYANTGGVPTAAVTDLATTMDINIIGISGSIAEDMMAKHPFYVKTTIPANSYRGQTQDVETVAVLAVLVAQEDLDDDLVYWLTKTLIEKQPELAQAHAKGRELSAESAVQGMTVPFHPGAERYYKEIGAIP
jgi:uncharacterized protein